LSDHFASDDPTTFDPAAPPETIVLKVDHMRLELAWRDGKAAEVSAECLRAACRCAWCTRERIDGTFAASFDAITIDRWRRSATTRSTSPFPTAMPAESIRGHTCTGSQ
jgi:hypothetical protein